MPCIHGNGFCKLTLLSVSELGCGQGRVFEMTVYKKVKIFLDPTSGGTDTMGINCTHEHTVYGVHTVHGVHTEHNVHTVHFVLFS